LGGEVKRAEVGAAWLGLTRRYPEARVYAPASGRWAACVQASSSTPTLRAGWMRLWRRSTGGLPAGLSRCDAISESFQHAVPTGLVRGWRGWDGAVACGVMASKIAEVLVPSHRDYVLESSAKGAV